MHFKDMLFAVGYFKLNECFGLFVDEVIFKELLQVD